MRVRACTEDASNESCSISSPRGVRRSSRSRRAKPSIVVRATSIARRRATLVWGTCAYDARRRRSSRCRVDVACREKFNFKSSSISSPRGVRRSYVEAGVASLRALMAQLWAAERPGRPADGHRGRAGRSRARTTRALRPGARLARCCFGSPWCWVARTVLGGPRRRNAARVEPVIATAWCTFCAWCGEGEASKVSEKMWRAGVQP